MAGRGILSKILSSVGSYRNVLTNRVTVTVYQQQNAGLKTETKELLKSLKIPEHPKRPLTPYFRFLTEQRPLVQKEHPDWKLVDVTKQCAHDWKQLDHNLKEKYKEEYSKDVEVYERKSQQFTSSLTKQQAEALSAAKQEKRHDRKKRAIKKLYRENAKPKRPTGTFLYFVKDKWALPENKDKKLAELLSAVKDEWNTMPVTKKEKYIKLSEADRKRYEKQMEEWEARMIKEGKSNMVRKDRQILSSSKPSHLDKPKHKRSG